MKISRLHIVRISTLRWTEFHQNLKDPIREIQRFPNLGHNLHENDEQTLHGLYLINYEIHLFILGILITQPFPQKSHECALKLTDLWIKSLLFDLNYKFINWSFAFSPG